VFYIPLSPVYLNQYLVLLAILTSAGMTGTSTITPTTVARSTPESNPKSEMATASAR